MDQEATANRVMEVLLDENQRLKEELAQLKSGGSAAAPAAPAKGKRGQALSQSHPRSRSPAHSVYISCRP